MSSRGGAGRLFTLWHRPAGTPRGAVLYLHPFAEELNKTRRMAALQARALAAAGWVVLQLDLSGCGDSSGEFAEATWVDWQADASDALAALRAQHPSLPITVWGLRAGALLANALVEADGDPQLNLLLWQPTPFGAGVLRQFLRTAAASALLDGGGKGVVDQLRQQLATGRTVEVGGYGVHPALALGLEAAALKPPARAGRVWWLEVAAQVSAGFMPASTEAQQAWQAAAAAGAFHFEARLLSGPPFWQTAEIETAPALIEATVAALRAAEA